MSRRRPDWSRPLPQPFAILDSATGKALLTMTTLADVRALIARHIPPARRALVTWCHVAACLDTAARGDATAADVTAALWLVLQLERVPCRTR